jgi:uncharacterized protein
VNTKPIIAILAALVVVGCSVATLSLPSVTDGSTGLRAEGKIIWHDLITHTPTQSQRFYSELFGWEFETVGIDLGLGNSIDYKLIRHEGQLIGGMVDANQLGRADPATLSQWLIAMSVADVDAAARQVEARGGRVLTPPTDVAARGRLALVEDAENAVFVLLETPDSDPADRQAPVGGFLWDELWSNEVAGAADFYAAIAPYDHGVAATAGGNSYQYLSSSGVPRVGILPNPAAGFRPTWVSYVRVADTRAITARVAGLGGRVLVEPRPRDLGGEVAPIADPSGAGIAIQTWSASGVAARGAGP